jgi:4-hydroxy-tetrahydrodipicolinate reductase
VPKKSGKNLKIALVGADGRMGQEIRAVAKEASCEIVATVSEKARWAKISLSQVDVVVDFSSPEGLQLAREWCVKNNKPLLSGTTGLSDADQKALKAAAKTIPVLYSANMSLGVAVMSAMLEQLKALGEDWDFQVDEIHHNQKKDRPSGTALMLDRKLSQIRGRKLPTPNSIRGGGVPGIHQVWAMGPDEVLVLQHTAFQRRVFARGALKAARWLFDKGQPGLYDLSHLFAAHKS